VRPLTLARALDPETYDVHFACDSRFDSVIGRADRIQYLPLWSIPPERFLGAVNRSDFPFTDDDLEVYLEQEKRLIDQVRPDLIVSDLRLTVSISAELASIPHAAVTNLAWSPHRRLGFPPVPPSSTFATDGGAGRKAPARRSASAVMNRFRDRHGLPAISGICELICRGDYTLYADPEGLIETAPLPDTDICLGSIDWSPPVPNPVWWGSWDPQATLVYFAAGSTGDAEGAPALIRSLAEMGVTVLTATSGRVRLDDMPPNVLVADFLPGKDACRLSSAVVSNGGSATSYQALAAGAPVLGQWSNVDQYLCAMSIQQSGAGLAHPAAGMKPGQFRELASRLLEDAGLQRAAQAMAAIFAAQNAPERFRHFVRGVLN
jgi:UDP:flavonoid glycosyltransferase YjiC (YdhE family)